MRNETINGCDGERLVLLLPACVQFLLFCFVLFCFVFIFAFDCWSKGSSPLSILLETSLV